MINATRTASVSIVLPAYNRAHMLPLALESIRAQTFHSKSQRQKPWFDEQTFLALLRLRGMEANSASRYAEAFYCRKAVLG
jgi:hypothetical protein